MCLSLTYSLPLYLSISPSLSLSLCLSLPLFIFLVLYLSFTSPSHLPSSSHHDRSVSVPTSLVTLGLLHSFLHHLSFHIYLLSHKHMNTITAAIFQLEVLGTAIANPMPPKPFCLQIDSYGMGWLLARIGCQPRGSQRDNWLRAPQRFATRICYSCRCHALPLSYAADTVAAAHTVAAAASLPLSYAAAAPLPLPLAAARYLQKTLIILTRISIKCLRTSYDGDISRLRVPTAIMFFLASANTPEALMFLVRGRNSLPTPNQLAQVRGRNSPEAETASPCMWPNETQPTASQISLQQTAAPTPGGPRRQRLEGAGRGASVWFFLEQAAAPAPGTRCKPAIMWRLVVPASPQCNRQAALRGVEPWPFRQKPQADVGVLGGHDKFSTQSQQRQGNQLPTLCAAQHVLALVQPSPCLCSRGQHVSAAHTRLQQR